MTNKKYQVIYADPPWYYNDKSKSHGGGAESHYPTMKIEELCKLNIPSADNSVLLLWVTYPQLEESFKVIKAWGFKYKTVAFTWVKTTLDNRILMGMGRYTRANAEICLLATKGKGCKRLNCSIKNTQLYPRQSHSEKPSEFRDEIVKLFGDLPRIELFARQKVDGWDSIGFDIDGCDIRESIKLL
jgi:site-specific DNA-methyltransferase (adenine-specific)